MRQSLVRGLSLALVGVACLMLPAAAPPAKPTGKTGKVAFAHIGDLDADIAVLNVIHALSPTAAQEKALLAVAGKTMQPALPRKLVKVSAQYLRALKALREALAGGSDEVEKEQTALAKLREKEDHESDDVEITEEARKVAPALLRQFSARQVAFYVGGLDPFPDPLERLTQAMEEARTIDKKEWPTLREEIALQVGWLVAGLDEAAEEKVRDKATALLTRAGRLTKRGYQRQRDALEKEARAIVGGLGPTDVIRHFMERVVAETLSNHRFEAAMKLRQRRGR